MEAFEHRDHEASAPPDRRGQRLEASPPPLRRPAAGRKNANAPSASAAPQHPLAMVRRRLEAALADPGRGIPEIEALALLHDRLAQAEARRAFTAALARLQRAVPAIPERGEIRDADGRPLGAYALWEDCVALLRAPLARQGFALSFRTETGAGALTVTARLAHVAGHVEETSLALPFDASGWKNPLQAIGSAAAYGKRYAAQALLNLVSEGDDDDGRAGGGGPALDADELGALRAALAAADAAEDKLARYLGVSALEALPAARLAEAQAAVAALAARRRA